MTTKNLLLIIPELTMGGAQRSLSKLSIELAKRHNVWLLIFNREHSFAYEYGGELLSLDVVPGAGPHGKVLAFIRRIQRLKKLKAKFRIDVSISFLEGADYINVLSRSGEKVVLSIRGSKEHDETIHGKYSWLRKKVLIPWLYKKADAIVAVNNGIVSELTNQYGLGKLHKVVIGNYYNIQEIVQLSNEKKDNATMKLYSDPVLVTTGRFAPEKGLENLLVVFQRLKSKQMPNLRLVMIGDGPDLDRLILTAQRLGLSVRQGIDFNTPSDVVILRREPNVFKFLNGAVLYLMNSSSEGFPNGLAEAMICGLPVVSSDCPYGPREILEPEFSFPHELAKPHISRYGVLMPVIKSNEDIELWVATLSSLVKDNQRRLEIAKNARDRIALFDKDLIISQWFQIVE